MRPASAPSRSAPCIASTSRKARCSERGHAAVHGHPAQGPHPRAAHPRDADQHDPLRAAGDGDLPLRLHREGRRGPHVLHRRHALGDLHLRHAAGAQPLLRAGEGRALPRRPAAVPGGPCHHLPREDRREPHLPADHPGRGSACVPAVLRGAQLRRRPEPGAHCRDGGDHAHLRGGRRVRRPARPSPVPVRLRRSLRRGGVRHLRLRHRRVIVKQLISAPALFVGAGICLVSGLLLAFLYAPVDASSMGFSQKIFYYHAPIAETALLAFGIAFVAAIAYLRTQNPKWDRLGVVCVRLGLLFSLLVMITGMIWGKAAWDAWWAWEPRLTTFLLVCFLYIAYLVLRSVVEEEQRRATYAAVFAIIAFIDVPITFFATRFLPEGLHPVVITAGGTGMEGSMLVGFLISMLGMTLLLVALIRRDLAVEDLKDRVADLKHSIGG